MGKEQRHKGRSHITGSTKAIGTKAGRGQERELVLVVESLKAIQKRFGLESRGIRTTEVA